MATDLKAYPHEWLQLLQRELQSPLTPLWPGNECLEQRAAGLQPKSRKSSAKGR
ncbi:hypothetical protein NDK37_21410 [Xanthomonas citri pv. glycines]|uniref:hypothetical protein n=1 Tax=Xanthomonas TaxID=338 RepID=UPI000A645633|nr:MULTISPECIES: hypothetical protein [Xanthomonas]UIE41700.1 hypothetical protein FICKIIDM_00800 [Xanthomonas citri pv. punicae]UIS26905.1 hypothetical protein KOJCDNHJ_00290 [Xanthomonas citri pv. punicae]WLA19684.1 hypothetical protein NDK37_21410 [Xanthomonas citri pv. glycines]